jgi:hypothetical protein
MRAVFVHCLIRPHRCKYVILLCPNEGLSVMFLMTMLLLVCLRLQASLMLLVSQLILVLIFNY